MRTLLRLALGRIVYRSGYAKLVAESEAYDQAFYADLLKGLEDK